MGMHFGIKVSPGKYGLKLERDKYAIINKRNSLKKFDKMLEAYEDEQGKFYTDTWCLKHQKDCLENFDLHMEFFSKLDNDKFNSEINNFLAEYTMFLEVENLNDFNGVEGYYVMIFDEYSQVYIGTTKDILKRVRQHWTRTRPFDRLLFPIGAVETSIMSIDSFRVLDNTRLLAYKTNELYTSEDKFIFFFSPEFCTNRMGGVRVEGGLLGALKMIRSRKLK